MKNLMISIIMGTRPEIIKMAPIIQELNIQQIPFETIFTDQHYQDDLSKCFFQDLELKSPDYHLNIGSSTPGAQTGNALIKIEEILLKKPPSLVLVVGDTNSVLAGALAAQKLQINIGHIEAGLRSNDFRMPEELNRRIVDHISKYLFAPTEIAVDNLKAENVWGEIHHTGNTIIDVCLNYYEIAMEKSKILEDIDFKEYVLVTFHRAENIDDVKVLKKFVDLLGIMEENVVFPIHHRTLKNLKKFGLLSNLNSMKNIQMIPPVGYFDILKLLNSSKYIITDSGGIQEEVTAPVFQKKCFVLRKSTERPEAVKAGFLKVVGNEPQEIMKAISQTDFTEKISKDSPYGNGNAAKKIIAIIKTALEINPYDH